MSFRFFSSNSTRFIFIKAMPLTVYDTEKRALSFIVFIFLFAPERFLLFNRRKGNDTITFEKASPLRRRFFVMRIY